MPIGSGADSMVAWAHVKRPGVLSHADLVRLVDEGKIVTCPPGRPARDAVKESCIELSISEEATRVRGGRQSRITAINAGFRLKPSSIMTFTTREHLDLPLDCLGRIYPRGRMTNIGLMMASTNVDPGFKGSLKLTVVNVGDVDIILPIGTEVAKLELEKMPEANQDGYRGAHSGREAPPFEATLFDDAIRESQVVARRKAQRLALLSAGGLVALLLIAAWFFLGPFQSLDTEWRVFSAGVAITTLATTARSVWRHFSLWRGP